MQGLMCLAQGHNPVTPVGLEPTAPRSRVKYSITELLRSLRNNHVSIEKNLNMIFVHICVMYALVFQNSKQCQSAV